LEPKAEQQLRNVASLPIVYKWVAAMPDVHWGMGVTIGSVIPTKVAECWKDKDVIDETPGAYKPIDAVMQAQKDLVDIVHTLRQVVCVKG
jgi:RNA-splicing ligase RtcB